jgi:NADPH2:quinone reductase
MKAIRVHEFGGPEVLKLEEVAKPTAGAGEVVIAVKAIGVNPVETYMRSGSNPNLARPYTPGLDAAGVIEAVGEGVTNLKIGDRVYTSDCESGAYAEFTLAKASDVHRLPERIGFEQAAGLNVPYATAYRGLFQKARARAGETVFIHGGSGGVGIAAIQWCKARGIRCIATGGTEEGRQLALREGADEVLDHRAPDYLEKLRGREPNVILEMLSNVNLARDLTAVAQNGRIVVIGSRGKVEINPRDAMLREVSIFGLMLFNASETEMREIHAAIGAGLENGSLRPIVGKKFALADAAKAHEAVMTPGAYGKIILIP